MLLLAKRVLQSCLSVCRRIYVLSDCCFHFPLHDEVAGLRKHGIKVLNMFRNKITQEALMWNLQYSCGLFVAEDIFLEALPD